MYLPKLKLLSYGFCAPGSGVLVVFKGFPVSGHNTFRAWEGRGVWDEGHSGFSFLWLLEAMVLQAGTPI